MTSSWGLDLCSTSCKSLARFTAKRWTCINTSGGVTASHRNPFVLRGHASGSCASAATLDVQLSSERAMTKLGLAVEQVQPNLLLENLSRASSTGTPCGKTGHRATCIFKSKLRRTWHFSTVRLRLTSDLITPGRRVFHVNPSKGFLTGAYGRLVSDTYTQQWWDIHCLFIYAEAPALLSSVAQVLILQQPSWS